MKLDQVIYRHSWVFFVLFFLAALVAFWPSYFAKLDQQEHFRFHTHGLAMTTWCIMLILQATFIRLKVYKLHKFLGWSSYAIFPLIIIATINLIHFGFQELRPYSDLPNIIYANVALMVNAVIALTLLYGLAIYNRKKPLIHARYMIGTVFTMFTPVTDRLIYRHFRELLNYVPVIDGRPFAPGAGFLLADIMLAGLVLWDGLKNKRWNVFPIILLILVLYHCSVLYWHDTTWWKSFSQWFIHLPLS